MPAALPWCKAASSSASRAFHLLLGQKIHCARACMIHMLQVVAGKQGCPKKCPSSTMQSIFQGSFTFCTVTKNGSSTSPHTLFPCVQSLKKPMARAVHTEHASFAWEDLEHPGVCEAGTVNVEQYATVMTPQDWPCVETNGHRDA